MSEKVFKFSTAPYFFPKCQILAEAWNNGVAPDRLKNAGNYTNAAVSWDVQKTQIYSNETSVRTLVLEQITSVAGTVKLTLQQIDDLLRRISWSADTKFYNQDAAVAATKDFTGLKVGDILDTGVIGLTSATLAEDALEYGVNIDSASGHVEVISLPDGATGDATLTWSAPAITDAAKKTEYSILQSDVITLSLFIRQVHDGGDMIWLPKVTFTVDGDLTLGKDGTDPGDIQITGTIVADDTQPPGREYGWVVPVADAA